MIIQNSKTHKIEEETFIVLISVHRDLRVIITADLIIAIRIILLGLITPLQ